MKDFIFKNMVNLFIILVSFFTITNVRAETLAIDEESNFINDYRNYPYVIKNYNVDIIVNENNTFDVTETIDVYFNEHSHGIIRMIPVKNEVIRLDGTSNKNTAIIKNLKVNGEFKVFRKKDVYSVRIGDPFHEIIRDEKYIISYNYNIGKDQSDSYDELYYNIIGNDWDTAIGNTTFKIVMPKSFDASKLGFSRGYIDSTNSDGVEYSVNGNIIEGRYNRILYPQQALTVRLELPEGYFVGAKNGVYITELISNIYFIIPLILFITIIVLWNVYTRKNEIIETIEFYPPEGLNSLDVALLYNGNVYSNDVVSLLIYLANKGYIEIIDDKVKIEQIKNNLAEKIDEEALEVEPFALRKIKEYDGDNECEKIFMEKLFPENKKIVTNYELYNKFYSTIDKLERKMNNKKRKKKIFAEENEIMKKIINIMILVIGLVILIGSTYIIYNLNTIDSMTGDDEFGIFINAFLGLVTVGSVFMMLRNSKNNTLMAIGCMPFLFFLAFMLWFFYTCVFFFCFGVPKIYLLGYVLGIVYIGITSIYVANNKKRTKYGNNMLGRIKGFRNFLMIVEKEKLEALVEKYPTYFYDILPYTYVLGLSKTWIEKFESINLEAPTWYLSENDFDFSRFKSNIDTTLNSIETVMSSDPTDYTSFDSSSSSSFSSSSSRSSGGGSSGGGSGGGGGRSW